MSTILQDRNKVNFTVDSATSDGVQPVVTIRFGSNARRVFAADQWIELDRLMRASLGLPQ